MALIIGQKTIEVERRFRKLIIETNLKTNEYNLVIDYDDGFYDENGVWNTIVTGTKILTSDQIFYLWRLDAKSMVKDPNNCAIGEVIKNSIYLILGNNLRIDLVLKVNVVNENNEPIIADVHIFKNDKLVTYFDSSSTYKGPLLLNPKVVVSAYGYESKEFNYSVLVGDVNLDVQLSSIPLE